MAIFRLTECSCVSTPRGEVFSAIYATAVKYGCFNRTRYVPLSYRQTRNCKDSRKHCPRGNMGHRRTLWLPTRGRICIFKKKINLSTSLAGQAVGIKEVDDGIWLVTFMDYDLGYIDLGEKTLQPLNNPFGPKV